MGDKIYSIHTDGNNEGISWYFTTQCNKTVSIKLYDNIRTYFQSEKSECFVDVPFISGTGILSGQNLELQISSTEEFVCTCNSSNILSDDGSLIGNRFCYFGYFEGSTTKNDFMVTITTLKPTTDFTYTERDFIAGLFINM